MVGHVAGLRRAGLVFLRHAGHDGDAENIFGFLFQELGIVALGDGTEHLLGTFRGGEVARQFGVLRAEEAHPAGAAGGEHGQLAGLGMGKALDELAALLQDGEVGREGGVENVLHAHGANGGSQALFRRLVLA